jgi:hypothetical protein
MGGREVRETRRIVVVIGGLLLIGLWGCRSVRPARVTGPTLPLAELTPEALGLKEIPPRAVTWANRAWASKPGLLLSLVSFMGAIQGGDLQLDKTTATKLVVVTSAINHCLY